MFVANLIEIPVALLADSPRRRGFILFGGAFFAISMLLTGLAQNFWMLLIAFMMFGPASGAFVALSEASLADHDPARREQNMARWELAGSVGVLVGSFAIGALAAQEVSWRVLFVGTAALSVVALLAAACTRVGRTGSALDGQPLLAALADGLKWAFSAVRRPDIMRWLVLLELSDLVGDILTGYLALYLVDVGGASPTQAAFGIGVWTVAGLVGDVMVVALLERMRGLTYLRLNSLASLALLVAFLLASGIELKFVLVALLGLLFGGRYAILQAQLYGALPGRSASTLALRNLSNLLGSLLPAVIGAAAAVWGLGIAMWLLLAGPLALLVATPRSGNLNAPDEDTA
jgi:FSR family fosmidomycin resistance protein-like MFS transporter